MNTPSKGCLLKGDKHDHPEELAAILARKAGESARIARELYKSSAALSERGESAPAALLTIGLCLEGALLPLFAESSLDILYDLHDILIGQEAPRLGKRE